MMLQEVVRKSLVLQRIGSKPSLGVREVEEKEEESRDEGQRDYKNEIMGFMGVVGHMLYQDRHYSNQ